MSVDNEQRRTMPPGSMMIIVSAMAATSVTAFTAPALLPSIVQRSRSAGSPFRKVSLRDASSTMKRLQVSLTPPEDDDESATAYTEDAAVLSLVSSGTSPTNSSVLLLQHELDTFLSSPASSSSYPEEDEVESHATPPTNRLGHSSERWQLLQSVGLSSAELAQLSTALSHPRHAAKSPYDIFCNRELKLNGVRAIGFEYVSLYSLGRVICTLTVCRSR
jgi:hypothetical protein